MNKYQRLIAADYKPSNPLKIPTHRTSSTRYNPGAAICLRHHAPSVIWGISYALFVGKNGMVFETWGLYSDTHYGDVADAELKLRLEDHPDISAVLFPEAEDD